jgi:L-phenylalanine/L-methionine N-acetyltransferase
MTVEVRAPTEADRSGIGEIYAAESVIRQTGQPPHRGDTFWRTFYVERDAILELIALLDGKVVGHLGVIGSKSPRTHHAASFGISVHADFQGKGVGSALMREMLHTADNYLSLIRLDLIVHTDNAPAIALYEKFGFEREGTARYDIFTEGRYRHGLRMARINPNFASTLGEG